MKIPKIEYHAAQLKMPYRVTLYQHFNDVKQLIKEHGPDAMLNTEWDYEDCSLVIIGLRDETPEEREKRIEKEKRAAERAALKAASPEEKAALKKKIAKERQEEKDRKKEAKERKKEAKERKLLAELKAKYE